MSETRLQDSVLLPCEWKDVECWGPTIRYDPWATDGICSPNLTWNFRQLSSVALLQERLASAKTTPVVSGISWTRGHDETHIL